MPLIEERRPTTRPTSTTTAAVVEGAPAFGSAVPGDVNFMIPGRRVVGRAIKPVLRF